MTSSSPAPTPDRVILPDPRQQLALSEAELEAGRLLFLAPADLAFVAEKVEGLPLVGLPEVAFAGRSNVGKSSLVNALTGRTTLARVSDQPGRTQALMFYRLGPSSQRRMLNLVDMPGYGFAKVPKAQAAGWGDLIRLYLRGRPNLARVLLLIDARRGLMDSDRAVMALMDEAAVPYVVVLTKIDAIKVPALAQLLEETQKTIIRHPAAHPVVIASSAWKREGVEALRALIAAHAGTASAA